MKFYCIVSDIDAIANPEAFGFLKSAVESRHLEFIVIDAKTALLDDYTLENGDILYRMGLSPTAVIVEGYLLRPEIRSFYEEPNNVFMRAFAWGSTIRLKQAGFAIVPTLFNPRFLSHEQLQEKVAQLGGYPIVVKGSGGSHGSEVRKADSLESLTQIFDENPTSQLVLRQFIHNARHIRCVVVGSRVVDAIEYIPQPDDFRTNAVAVPQVTPFDSTGNDELLRTAAEAVNRIGLYFGGVDILMQPDGVYYIAEVNFPCNFARNQINTGVDVAGAMVDFLMTRPMSQ